MSNPPQTSMQSAFATNAKFFVGLFTVYLIAGIISTSLLMLTGFLHRQELQTINNRFEARPWLLWNEKSLARLDLNRLMEYHEKHEINKSSYNDTLSWLLEENHAQPRHKFVLFNRLPEDEPPLEAIETLPWMAPLKDYPLSRKTVADMIDFLSASGAKLIILDNDFPQYSEQDAALALAIHNAGIATANKPAVPVLFARTISRRSTDQFLVETQPTVPHGVLRELSRLEPDVDVLKKYTGIPAVLPDEDQVVRQAVIRLKDSTGAVYESIAEKASTILNGGAAGDYPDVIDIDFNAPPNSNVYPVRALWYLLDPKQKQRLAAQTIDGNRKDVSIKDATVVIGDSIVDIFSTPLTNLGVDQMSGSEVLVNSIDTLSRRSWPKRLDDELKGLPSFLYTIILVAAGALTWMAWKLIQLKNSVGQGFVQSLSAKPTKRIVYLTADLLVLTATICGSVLISLLLFTYGRLIVPVMVPGVALALGAVAAIIWEREKEREETFRTKLGAAEEKLKHAHEKFEADLKRQAAEARARDLLNDQERKKEFARRINHDLNAPVSVLNWTLVELQEENLPNEESKEKINRLMNNSDRLCELIDQLVQTYDHDAVDRNGDETEEHCNLASLLVDLADLEQPLASMRGSTIDVSVTENSAEVNGNRHQIMRIIDNLVRNALKHNEPGTRVKLSLEENGNDCIVKVNDDGRGIAEDHLQHIFESGYRVRASDSDGQGLGLDIVRTLVEDMQGRIEVQSEVGAGTTFIVKFKKHTEEHHDQNFDN